MKATLVAVGAVLLGVVSSAPAHRLDEFLQGTTIALDKNQVTARIHLIPGVAVARTVLADLDADGNGIISDVEQHAYVDRVLRDLSLTIDGQRLPLRLVSSYFPHPEQIEEGLGVILLTFRGDVPQGGRSRRLVFENHYRSGMAAYLVNGLFPADPDIRVSAQKRNDDQSIYQMDYTQTASAEPRPALSFSAPTTGELGVRSDQQPLLAAYSLRGVHHILTDYVDLFFLSALVLGGAGWLGLTLQRRRPRVP